MILQESLFVQGFKVLSLSGHPTTKPSDDIPLFLNALESAGVEVRFEPVEGAGGLAKVGGKHIFFVNERAAPEETLDNCIAALKKFVSVVHHLPPRVRDLLGENEGWGDEPAKKE
jgi:hypothetical protein